MCRSMTDKHQPCPCKLIYMQSLQRGWETSHNVRAGRMRLRTKRHASNSLLASHLNFVFIQQQIGDAFVHWETPPGFRADESALLEMHLHTSNPMQQAEGEKRQRGIFPLMRKAIISGVGANARYRHCRRRTQSLGRRSFAPCTPCQTLLPMHTRPHRVCLDTFRGSVDAHHTMPRWCSAPRAGRGGMP
jgi:hypothetical protein